MFKEITLPVKPLSSTDKNLVQQFNQHFKPDEVRIIPNGKSIEIQLKQVDFSRMEKIVSKLTKASGNGPLTATLDAVRNIKSYGLKGKKRLYVGYNKERKVKNRAEKEKQRGKHFYAKGNTFKKTNNEVPKKFVDKIVCGDSKKVLSKLPDNCVDMVFTSPPYNFGLAYNQTNDDYDWNEYFDKLFKVFDQCIRVLKYGGRIIVNIQPLFSDYIPSHHIISKYFMDKKMIWKGEIMWEKNNYNCKYTAWGSWKSPSSPYLKYTWEFIEIFCKGDMKKEGDSKNIDISADEFKKWVVGKWSVAPERKMKKYGHPAMFPEEIATRAIKLFSFRGDLILDPFNGVGTTTAVAKKTNRSYLGIDISKTYCEAADKRANSLLFEKTEQKGKSNSKSKAD
ncbi:DNA-methyltransferase [Candidatus Mycalebacterium sp.]